MTFTEKPEYGRVVDICTKDALRELATPGLLAVLAPIAVGFALGVGPLGAYLAGAIGTGALMAVFLANSGGAWDNAKKLVEDGNHGGKGSEAHEATIIGDTVGRAVPRPARGGRTGRTGSGRGCRAAVTRGSCSARCRTSRSTPSCGSGTPVTTAATRRSTRRGTTRGWTSSRRAR
ncbi:Putative K(+)-stimulated pyrophosphate-energized sodium pump [Streptomyces tanashiensis]